MSPGKAGPWPAADDAADHSQRRWCFFKSTMNIIYNPFPFKYREFIQSGLCEENYTSNLQPGRTTAKLRDCPPDVPSAGWGGHLSWGAEG